MCNKTLEIYFKKRLFHEAACVLLMTAGVDYTSVPVISVKSLRVAKTPITALNNLFLIAA